MRKWMAAMALSALAGGGAGMYGQAAQAPAAGQAAQAPAAGQGAGGQGAGGPQDLQKLMQRLVQVQEEWGAKRSSPGMSLKLVPKGTRDGKIRYEMQTTGAPRDKVYTMVSWPIQLPQPREDGSGVTLNAAGIAMCEGGGKKERCSSATPNDPIDLAVAPKAGEPIRVGLLSLDHKVELYASVVPVPLRGTDRGCTLETTLLTQHAEIVWVEVRGLAANESFTISSQAVGGELVKLVKKANDKGVYKSVMLPEQQGVKSGVTTVEAKGASCAASVKIPWGT